MSNLHKNSITKNLISGMLLLGGVAAGLLGASKIVKATQVQNEVKQDQKNTNKAEDFANFSHMLVPLSKIESEDMLVKLVIERGTQLFIDDKTQKLYMAYVNESQQVEIVETNAEEINQLLNQISLISETDDSKKDNNVQKETEKVNKNENTKEQVDPGNFNENGYIPEEYWRGSVENKVDTQNKKKERIRLDSEEGRQAIEKARNYKKNNIK